eukprot:964892-Prorocentrum_minimum.AAC.2
MARLKMNYGAWRNGQELVEVVRVLVATAPSLMHSPTSPRPQPKSVRCLVGLRTHEEETLQGSRGAWARGLGVLGQGV